MGKIVVRLLFLVSLAFNVAFVLYLVAMNKEKSAPQFESSLTADQALQLRQIHAQNLPRHDALAQQLGHYQFELLSLLKTDAVDQDKLAACLQSIQQNRSEEQKQVVAEIMQSKKLLTKAQCGCLLDQVGETMKVSNHHCNADCCQPKAEKEKNEK